MNKDDFENLAKQSALIAADKKAEDALILDVSSLTPTAYFFTIIQANSSPQISAVCDEIEKQFKEKGIAPIRKESRNSTSWRVIDYGGLIVHIMTQQIRHTYKIEEFWKEAQTVDFMSKQIKTENQKETAAPASIEKTKKQAKKSVKKNAKDGGKKTKTAKTKKTIKKAAAKSKPAKKSKTKPAKIAAKKPAKKSIKKPAKKTQTKAVKKVVKKPVEKTAKKTLKKTAAKTMHKNARKTEKKKTATKRTIKK